MSQTKSRVLLGLPIFFAAVNMRAGFVLINPLVPLLKAHFHLSNTAISVLAGIPLFCFAASAIFMSRIGRLGSSTKIIKFALTTLTIGLILRSITGLPGLYIFTFLIGGSIAIMNFELPAWIKANASKDIGFMTGSYSTIMGAFGGLAIAIAVPLSHVNSWGWKFSILPWTIIAAITTFYWYSRKSSEVISETKISKPFWRTPTFKNPLAWAMVCYFGFQSFTYYSTATWLPTILTTKGFALRDGALLVSVTGITGSLIGLMAPHYISKYQDKRKILVFNSLLIVLGFMMTILQSGPILWIWLLISNIGMSINFPMALTLAGLKTKSAETTRNLSTMMQSIGYLIAAIGPTYVGGIFDISKSWNWAIFGATLIAILQVLIAFVVGKESYID
jgi:CP family cyanate transporter-like MFS transporter